MICGDNESKFRKELISLDAEKRLGTAIEIIGKCNTKKRSEWNCSRRLKWQLNKQNAAVHINSIREESAIHFYLFRNEADSFNSMSQLTKKYVYTYFKFTCRFLFQQLGLFLLGLTQNSSCQEWTTPDKKVSLNYLQFHLFYFIQHRSNFQFNIN